MRLATVQFSKEWTVSATKKVRTLAKARQKVMECVTDLDSDGTSSFWAGESSAEWIILQDTRKDF